MKKLQREQARLYKEKVESWYNDTYNGLCDVYQFWDEIRVALKGEINSELYKKALDKTLYYDYLIDEFRNEKDKTKLYKNRGSFEWERYARTIL